MDDDTLIERYVEPDPWHPWAGDARLRESGVHVWALIGHWHYGTNQDTEAVARDYNLPLQEVQAALAYYRRHTAAIDARLEQNQPVAID